MPDRLDELKRQRALVQEHLAWLDREIAREAGRPAPLAPAPAPADIPEPAAKPPAGGSAADADSLIAQYRAGAEDPRADVRKGCLIYFLGGFALLGVLIAGFALYFASRR